MKFKLLFSITFLFPAALSGQKADYNLFMNAAAELSVLYRGELPVSYGSRIPTDNSIYYAWSTNFEAGEVIFCGKLYQNILLNLNAHLDELYVQEPVQGMPVLVNKNFVESFSIGKHKFVNYQQEKNTTLNLGYYEVLFTGNVKLYKKIRKIYYEKPGDRGRMQRGFTLFEGYYVCKNDQWVRINKKGDVTKLFPEHKKAIDKLSKSMNFTFKEDKERFLMVTLDYINNL